MIHARYTEADHRLLWRVAVCGEFWHLSRIERLLCGWHKNKRITALPNLARNSYTAQYLSFAPRHLRYQ